MTEDEKYEIKERLISMIKGMAIALGIIGLFLIYESGRTEEALCLCKCFT